MKYTMEKVDRLSKDVAQKLIELDNELAHQHKTILVGIPRGGIPAAYAIAQYMPPTIEVTSVDDNLTMLNDNPFDIIVLVDDITTTGETIAAAKNKMPDPLNTMTAVLLSKNYGDYLDPPLFAEQVATDDWVEFPWESRESGGKPLDAVRRLIEYVGDDPTRPGLLETPERVLRYLDEVRDNNKFEPTAFESNIEDLQAVGNINFSSLCEHHILPWSGVAALGYVPTGKLLGLSKLVRVMHHVSSGLTMQEEVTHKAAMMVSKITGSPDVAVVTHASHTCMTTRGVRASGSLAISSAMLGKFRDSPALRAEFMSLAGIS